MNDLVSLSDLFAKKLFRIPDYQRGYSWGNLQLEELWSDILNLLPNREHYTGMISLKELNGEYTSGWNDEKWILDNWGYKAYHVVDGQQRLTTFIILINEIVNYYEQQNPGKELTQIFVNSLRLSDIKEQYLVIAKPDSTMIRTFKFGYETDNPSYEFFKYKILEEQNPGIVNETFYTLNLENAKEFFKEHIKDLVEKEGVSALEDVFKKITQKMKFNIYFIDNDFNVFIAFETMNNRGKRLSNLELLKNRLIYLSTIFHAPEDELNKVRNEINETWKTVYACMGKNKTRPLNDDEFLQAHWIVYFGYSRSNKMNYTNFLLNDYFTQQNIETKYTSQYKLTEIQEEYPEDAIEVDAVDTTEEPQVAEKGEKLTIDALFKYISSMKSLVPFWYSLHFPDDITNGDIKMMLERLNRLGFVYFKPMIMVILSRKDISDENKFKALKLIERFILLHFRYAGYFSTYRNSYFYNLAHQLYVKEVAIDYVLEKLNEIDFLSDNKVATTSTLMGSVNRWFRNYSGYYSWASVKYVLFEYERYLMKDKASQKIMPENFFKKDEKDHYSVEHIYPQTASDPYWVSRFGNYDDNQKKRLTGTLGNLLPLSMSINSTLQNYSFDEKKTRSPRGYSDGSHSEIEVSKYSQWTSEEILDRGLKILAFMENEWDFIIPNKADRKMLLGLDFMIEDGDFSTDVTVPVFKEKVETRRVEDVYSEEIYHELIDGKPQYEIDVYNALSEYCLSLDSNVTRSTTKNYIVFKDKGVFLEIHFYKKRMRFILPDMVYQDEKGLVKKLPDSYTWTKNHYMDFHEDDDLDYAKNIIRQAHDYVKRGS
ncbi:MAG: DUF262 domain-containing protein [Erysipelotrichaceae bacterium]|nr:DUF262 domain-containing protein [Erysipelotrichaceae bacterium]